MIRKQDFFGRTAILDVLQKRVLDLKEGYRQNVAFLGTRDIGKTAILHHFLANIEGEGVTAVYLDLEYGDFRGMMEKFTGGLLYHYSKSRGLALHEDIALLLESTQESIPHTVQVIRKIYKDYHNRKLSTCFQGLLALPEIFTNESGRPCVLVLDEFQNLEYLPVANVFQHLGKKIMTQKKCLYVVTSSYPRAAKKILSEKLSLLFGNFEMINVDPFDPQTSRKFIDQALQDIRIGESLAGFLVDFTGGYPLYLHLICAELVRLTIVHRQNEIFVPVLTQAIENTLFDRWGVISRHFELMIQELADTKGDRLISVLLIAIANDRHKMDDLCKELGFTKSHLAPRINRLLEEGSVFKNGNFYYFRDKLLKYWIKYVFQQRRKNIDPEPQKCLRQFQEELQRAVDNFKLVFGKDLSSRIIELLRCFDNDAFDLNGRKYKLPVFREFAPMKMDNPQQGSFFDVIRASTADEVWLIAVKDENVGEAEVNTVMEESRKGKQKARRCLFISMKNPDDNTRLRALQEKFWIWSQEEINSLLTLFDKPYIAQSAARNKES